VIQQPLDADGAERGHHEQREVPQPARVVQVDVAERHLEHERAEPPGADEQRDREQVGEDPGDRERDRQVPQALVPERHRDQ
jgi:hypothetical protein